MVKQYLKSQIRSRAMLGLAVGFGLAIALFGASVLAQRQRPHRQKATVDAPAEYDNNLPKPAKDYSGRFTFARIRFDTSQYAQMYEYNMKLGDGGPPWSHDYPAAGRHLAKIIAEVSKTDITLDTNEPIFSFDNPGLFKYPFVYLCEVGFMNLNEKETAGMREYMLRGGFIMVDDFRHPSQFANFQAHIKRALPELELKKLDQSHPIFNCFFSIKTLDLPPVYGGYYIPEFWGLEDADGRLMMIVNYNYDMSDYWQFSDDPFRPIEETNEAYKFGVNYILYALTH